MSCMRTIHCLLFAFALSTCAAQTGTHDYVDSGSGIVTRFPASLQQRNPTQVILLGHLRNYGSIENKSDEHERAAHCMKPMMVADLPSTSGGNNDPAHGVRLMAFKFSLLPECTAGFKFQEPDAIAGGVAQSESQIPGSRPIGPPLWFDWGKDKLHLYVVAVGPDNNTPALIATATLLWKGQIFGWTLTADSPNTFNEYGQISVEVEPGRKYQIPFRVGSK